MYEFLCTHTKLLAFLTLETDFTYHHRDAFTSNFKTKEIILFFLYALAQWVVHVSGSNFINGIVNGLKISTGIRLLLKIFRVFRFRLKHEAFHLIRFLREGWEGKEENISKLNLVIWELSKCLKERSFDGN